MTQEEAKKVILEGVNSILVLNGLDVFTVSLLDNGSELFLECIQKIGLDSINLIELTSFLMSKGCDLNPEKVLEASIDELVDLVKGVK